VASPVGLVGDCLDLDEDPDLVKPSKAASGDAGLPVAEERRRQEKVPPTAWPPSANQFSA